MRRWYDNLPEFKQKAFRDFGNMALGSLGSLLIMNAVQLFRPHTLVYTLRLAVVALPLAGLLLAFLATRLLTLDDGTEQPEEEDEE